MASAAVALPGLPPPLAVSALHSSTPVSGAELDAIAQDLDAFVTRRMADLQVPGVAVGVVLNDEEYAAGFGVTRACLQNHNQRRITAMVSREW